MEIIDLIQSSLTKQILRSDSNRSWLRSLAAEVANRDKDPYTVSRMMLKEMMVQSIEGVKE
jgi:LAO/AO transport system kinase